MDITLKSKLDASVNFISSKAEDGINFLEARYVRRTSDYFIAYLSSQTGCKQACKFCHLTITKQNKPKDSSIEEIVDQAKLVIDHYNQQTIEKAKVIHFSFMARGEPLASKVVTSNSYTLFSKLSEEAIRNNLLPKIMVSTIMPIEVADKSLIELFPIIHPNIYYSIYSTEDSFRKKWLPAAMPVELAMSKLKEYQDHTNKIVRLHWSFIKNENDSEADVFEIINMVKKFKLRVDVNIVRYNPFSPEYGQESDMIQDLEYILKNNLTESKIKTVQRVGQDVYASCGTFFKD